MSREVTESKRDRDGDIIGLCGSGWSATRSEAVREIGNDRYAYYVARGGQKTHVRAATRNGNPYLTTDPDGIKPNNLDELPDC